MTRDTRRKNGVRGGCGEILKPFPSFQMRHVFVIMDASRAMEDRDMKPDRLKKKKKVSGLAIDEVVITTYCLPQVLDKFVTEFFDQNPISQVCECLL